MTAEYDLPGDRFSTARINKDVADIEPRGRPRCCSGGRRSHGVETFIHAPAADVHGAVHRLHQSPIARHQTAQRAGVGRYQDPAGLRDVKVLTVCPCHGQRRSAEEAERVNLHREVQVHPKGIDGYTLIIDEVQVVGDLVAKPVPRTAPISAGAAIVVKNAFVRHAVKVKVERRKAGDVAFVRDAIEIAVVAPGSADTIPDVTLVGNPVDIAIRIAWSHATVAQHCPRRAGAFDGPDPARRSRLLAADG